MINSTKPFTAEGLQQLYLHEGFSVHDIALKYGCSDNKVSYWLRKFDIPKRTISDAIYLKRNPNGDPFLFKSPSSKEEVFLFGLGIGLYWGEGTKRNRTAVRFGNTDPELIKLFIKFLTDIYQVPKEKFRFGLQVFSDMSAAEALKFWSTQIGFPVSQFGKVVITPARGVGNYRNKTKHGVLTIYVSNKKLRDLLCGEIEKMR